uniref:Beta_helix domain-containing protein n=1 Tax=Gongylonema pulchrum TaxID=637853 RepID=A0A183CWX8_9BILA
LDESFVEVEYFEGSIGGRTWQTRFITMTTKEHLLTLHTGKVFVDETAIIEAQTFNNCGLWNVKESVQISLKGSANFFASSKFSASLLKLLAQGHCTVAGCLLLENLLVYVRNDMITASGARINVSTGATVASGIFRNDSSWHSGGNLHLHVACFEQSEEALIFVKHTLSLAVYDFSEQHCRGRIVANYCVMKLLKKVRFDGYIRANQIEISVPHVNESRCTIGGQLEVLSGPLILKGRSLEHSKFSMPFSALVSHSYPGFVLEGQLKAEAVIAPFLAVSFSANSYSSLSGMDSVAEEADYRILISCTSLHTQCSSLINSVSQDSFPESIRCITSWIHEGQIRFHGDTVYIVSNYFVNRGRLASGNKFQNHMREVVVLVENFFQNDAVFSADRISVRGGGILENKNRIFASNTLNIQIAEKDSNSKQLRSGSMETKLLSASRLRNQADGCLKARGCVATAAAALNKYDLNKQVLFGARSQFFVDSDVLDDHSNMVLTARDAIIVKSKIVVNSLELIVGVAYTTEIAVIKSACLKSNELKISGSCNHLTLVIEGQLQCESIVIDAAVRQVKVIGRGILSCCRLFSVCGNSITLTNQDTRITELAASKVTLAPDNFLHLSSSDAHSKSVHIYTDECCLQGRIFLKHKTVLKTDSGAFHVDGEILGTCAATELSLECYSLIFSGTVANLHFLECYARMQMEQCETALIKHVKNIAIQAPLVSLCGKIVDPETLIVTGERVSVEGMFLNHNRDATYSIFSKNIQLSGEIHGPVYVELSGPEINLSGIFDGIKIFDVDAELVICSPRRLCTENFNLIACSVIFEENFVVKEFNATAKTSIFLRTSLKDCEKCSFVAPLVVAINCVTSPALQVYTLIYISEENEELASESAPEPNDLKTAFPLASNSPSSFTSAPEQRNFNSCRSQQLATFDVATVRSFIRVLLQPNLTNDATVQERTLWKNAVKAIAGCFRDMNGTDDEQFNEAVKQAEKLQPVNIHMPSNSFFRFNLLKLLDKETAHNGHTMASSLAKLLALLCSASDEFMTVKTNSKASCSSAALQECNRFESEPLYELANCFRLRAHKRKLSLPRYESKVPTAEDDVGYASRSSSEDIDEPLQNTDAG